MKLLIQAVQILSYTVWSFVCAFFESLPDYKNITDLKDKIIAFAMSDITGIPVWAIPLIISVISVLSAIICIITKIFKKIR